MKEADMGLTITSKEGGLGVVTVFPAGSLDSNTYTMLEDRLALIKKGNPRAIIFDLKGLTYISSAGVRVFVGLRKTMKMSGGTVAFANLQPQIRKVFDIIQALPSMNVFESVEELDKYLAEMQRKVKAGEKEEPR
jgi:anti-sigma B factor antagonist